MNAIKFCGAGDKVFFDINDFDSENICFKIKDQGNGMTQEKVETIFNQNKNKSTLGTEGEKGTGLGLLLCHDFVVHHGGKIWVESKLGEGTTISFTIPKSG
jgi:hypothetical protein